MSDHKWSETKWIGAICTGDLYSTKDFVDSISADDSDNMFTLAYQWQDKKHRHIFDLCKHIDKIESQLAASQERVKMLEAWATALEGQLKEAGDLVNTKDNEITRLSGLVERAREILQSDPVRTIGPEQWDIVRRQFLAEVTPKEQRKWRTGKPPKDGWYWSKTIEGDVSIEQYTEADQYTYRWVKYQWSGPIEPPSGGGVNVSRP